MITRDLGNDRLVLGDAHSDFIDNTAPQPWERTVPAVHTSDARVRNDADTWREHAGNS
ncbi:MAG: hypothetical protein IJ113_00960 [Eggerthellaceae bacterium]|nr:hypothetical protein [Eggerthellaceae bacterium]